MDLAACLLGTFQHLHTLDDGLQAMQRTHAALKPDGLFIIELEHPAQLFDGAMLSQGQTWNLQLDTGRVRETFSAAVRKNTSAVLQRCSHLLSDGTLHACIALVRHARACCMSVLNEPSGCRWTYSGDTRATHSTPLRR